LKPAASIRSGEVGKGFAEGLLQRFRRASLGGAQRRFPVGPARLAGVAGGRVRGGPDSSRAGAASLLLLSAAGGGRADDPRSRPRPGVRTVAGFARPRRARGQARSPPRRGSWLACQPGPTHRSALSFPPAPAARRRARARLRGAPPARRGRERGRPRSSIKTRCAGSISSPWVRQTCRFGCFAGSRSVAWRALGDAAAPVSSPQRAHAGQRKRMV
jgi:hypothetical protein